ncbi:hypothetical protein [Streptomyces sp. 142MFCol3.1]|uniref:hypothetical protein n=1 Tax=Streptomyces sp. 142MFCol3.1 TaxID=1172179 RepID=UPI001319F03E|nr:hypothetical protein [Streptomyces sp. 142MFCol3.1]
MHLDILYARENSLARSLPRTLTRGFADLWSWGSQQPLAGAYKSEIAEDAVSFLIGFHQVKNLSAMPTVPPGGWFHFSGPSRFTWDKDRKNGSVRIQRSGPEGALRALRAPVRAECMLTTTSWANLNGKVENTFLLGRMEASDQFDVYAAGHVNLFPGLTPNASENFRMMGHVIRNGMPEVSFGNLANFVDQLISTFSNTLLLDRGWSLVSASDSVNEKKCQTLFSIVAEYAVEKVLVDREPETGLGPIDFIISGFGERHGLEFKVFKGGLSALQKGLTIQLPSYMKSKKLDKGWFVVILSGSPGHSFDIADTQKKLQEINNNAAIEVRVLDARPQVSASRRDEVV